MLRKNAANRMETDGLNSINYKLVKTERRLSFTRFFISYNDFIKIKNIN